MTFKYLISFDFDEDATFSECGTDCAEDDEVMYLNTLWLVQDISPYRVVSYFLFIMIVASSQI